MGDALSNMSRVVLVLCEGKEDRLVFEKIASRASLSGLVFEDYGGKDNLLNHLRVLMERPEFTRNSIRRIAITRDADDSHDGAWKSLCSSVKAAFSVALASPGDAIGMPGGIPDKDPAIEIAGWVLPGDGKPGMLESLCLESVSERPEYSCLRDYVACLEKLLPSSLHPKAQFHAWIVSHADLKDKDYNIAKAVSGDRFNWEHSAFAELRAFLQRIAE